MKIIHSPPPHFLRTATYKYWIYVSSLFSAAILCVVLSTDFTRADIFAGISYFQADTGSAIYDTTGDVDDLTGTTIIVGKRFENKVNVEFIHRSYDDFGVSLKEGDMIDGDEIRVDDLNVTQSIKSYDLAVSYEIDLDKFVTLIPKIGVNQIDRSDSFTINEGNISVSESDDESDNDNFYGLGIEYTHSKDVGAGLYYEKDDQNNTQIDLGVGYALTDNAYAKAGYTDSSFSDSDRKDHTETGISIGYNVTDNLYATALYARGNSDDTTIAVGILYGFSASNIPFIYR